MIIDVKLLTRILTDRVRFNLNQLNISCKTDILQVAMANARYRESLEALQSIPAQLYPKDNENQAIIKRNIEKRIEMAEIEAFIGNAPLPEKDVYEPQGGKKDSTDE